MSTSKTVVPVKASKASKASKKVLVAGIALKGGHNRVVGGNRQRFMRHLDRFTPTGSMSIDCIERARVATLKIDVTGKCTAFGHTENGYATSIIDGYLLGVVNGTVKVVDSQTLIKLVACNPVVFSKCKTAKNGPVIATYDKVISHLAFVNPKPIWLRKAYNRATYTVAELNTIADCLRPLCTALRTNLMQGRKAYKVAIQAGRVKAITE